MDKILNNIDNDIADFFELDQSVGLSCNNPLTQKGIIDTVLLWYRVYTIDYSV